MAALTEVIDESVAIAEGVVDDKSTAPLLKGADAVAQGFSNLPEAVLAFPSGREGYGLEVESEVGERGFAKVLARFRAADGTVLTAGAVVSATLDVLDWEGRTVDAMNLTPGVVVRSDLSTAQGWRYDSVGWNFSHTYGGAAFTQGGTTYRLVYNLRDTSGHEHPLVHVVRVRYSGVQ